LVDPLLEVVEEVDEENSGDRLSEHEESK